MTTTVSIDKEVRDLAAAKAKTDKLSVSAVIRILLVDYAKGKINIGTHLASESEIEIIEVDQSTQKLMDKVVAEWHKNAK